MRRAFFLLVVVGCQKPHHTPPRAVPVSDAAAPTPVLTIDDVRFEAHHVRGPDTYGLTFTLDATVHAPMAQGAEIHADARCLDGGFVLRDWAIAEGSPLATAPIGRPQRLSGELFARPPPGKPFDRCEVELRLIEGTEPDAPGVPIARTCWNGTDVKAGACTDAWPAPVVAPDGAPYVLSAVVPRTGDWRADELPPSREGRTYLAVVATVTATASAASPPLQQLFLRATCLEKDGKDVRADAMSSRDLELALAPGESRTIEEDFFLDPLRGPPITLRARARIRRRRRSDRAWKEKPPPRSSRALAHVRRRQPPRHDGTLRSSGRAPAGPRRPSVDRPPASRPAPPRTMAGHPLSRRRR